MARRNGADDARGLRKMRGLSLVWVVMVFSAQRAVTTAAYRQLGALGDICNIIGIRNEENEAKISAVRLRVIRTLKIHENF